MLKQHSVTKLKHSGSYKVKRLKNTQHPFKHEETIYYTELK